MMTKATTGVDLIRGALSSRAKHSHLGTLARDLNCGLVSLEDFLYARGTLPTETLQALAKDMFPHAEYDAVLGLMRPINRSQSQPLGITQPPLDPALLPADVQGWSTAATDGIWSAQAEARRMARRLAMARSMRIGRLKSRFHQTNWSRQHRVLNRSIRSSEFLA